MFGDADEKDRFIDGVVRSIPLKDRTDILWSLVDYLFARTVYPENPDSYEEYHVLDMAKEYDDPIDALNWLHGRLGKFVEQVATRTKTKKKGKKR